MEKNPKVIITVGLPASGKSTWSEDYIRKNPDTVRVGRDGFRYMLRNDGLCEPKIESMINELIDDAIIQCLKRKLDVIVDNTNLKASHINQIIKLVEYQADVCFQVFNIPAKVCIERDKNREKRVGEEVINKMNEDWLILIDSFPFQDTKKKPGWKRPRITYKFESDKPTCVIFDIDGTLAEMYNREPFDWDKVDRDNPMLIVMEQVKFHKAAGRKIVIISGRDASCRDMTEEWLKFYGVEYDAIYMREKDSWEKDTAIKKRIYLNDIEPNYNTLCVYDDRLSVLKMWHKLGLFTFNCNQGNHDF